MARMEKGAVCKIHANDEIGILAEHINHLYKSLLSAIESLEIEKQRVSEIEKSKVDFLRAASHELKDAGHCAECHAGKYDTRCREI